MQKSSDDSLLFQHALRRHNLKSSKTRLAIYEVLAETNQPQTTQELAGAITGSHFVSVYRSVDALLKAGLIKQVPQGFQHRFELSDEFKPHHHHATCERCGATQAINNPAIESLMKKLTLKAGLQPTAHHFETYGICEQCQKI